jgi:hypothetical protein
LVSSIHVVNVPLDLGEIHCWSDQTEESEVKQGNPVDLFLGEYIPSGLLWTNMYISLLEMHPAHALSIMGDLGRIDHPQLVQPGGAECSITTIKPHC